MSKDIFVYLEDIFDAIERIQSYVQKGKRHFLSHEMVQDAVIRQISVIGEAVKHLPGSLKKNHTDIPWKKVTGMRDILVHEYSGINIVRIWKTVKEDLPPLKKTVITILKNMEI